MKKIDAVLAFLADHPVIRGLAIGFILGLLVCSAF